MKLDIGCGPKKLEGFTGMDIKYHEGVDIIHDMHKTPWPIEDESVEAIEASHVLEHIKPWKIFEVMDECWRICKFRGGIDIKVPFGIAYSLDPSHTILFNVASFFYFTKGHKFYDVYKPKPWKMNFSDACKESQEIRVILEKIKE